MVDKAYVNPWEAGDCPAIIGAGSAEGDQARGTFAEPGDLHKIVVYDPNGLCERLIGYIDEPHLPRHTGVPAFASATAMRRASASMQSSHMSSTTMLTSTSAVAVLDLEEVFGSAEAWQLWGNGDEPSEGADIAGQQFLALGGTWQSAWTRKHHPAAGAPLHVRYGRRNSSQNRPSRAGSSGGGSVDDGFVSIGYQIVDGRPVLRGIMSSTLGSSINYSDGEGFESFAERMATQRGSDLTLAERQLAEGQSPNTTRLDGQGRRVSIIPEVSTRREREESLDPSHDCTEPKTHRSSVSKPAASPMGSKQSNSARRLHGAAGSPANSVHASPAELQTALVQCLQSHIQQVERQHSGASTNPQVVRDVLTDTQPIPGARSAYGAGASLQPVSPYVT